jgi:hypothetical protein
LEALPEAAPARQYLLLTAPQRRGAMREVLRLTSQPGSFRRPELTPESIEELKKRLSPEAQARLARREAEGGKPEQLIDWWIWQAARDAQRKYFDSLLADIPDQELAQFFETLPIKERNDLLDKWSEYGQAALKIKYLQKHLADKLPPILRNAEVGGGGFRRPPFEGSSRPGDGRRGGPGSGGGAGGASSGQRGGVTGSANPNGSGGTGGTRPPLPSESVDPPNRGD